MAAEQPSTEPKEAPDKKPPATAEERLEERIREREERKQAAEPDRTPDDDDADADIDAAPPQAQPQKRNRWREMNDKAAAAEAKAAAAEQRAEQAMKLLSEHQQRVQSQPQPQPQTQPGADPSQAAEDAIYEEQAQLYRMLQLGEGKLSAAELDRIDKRSRELERSKLKLVAEQTIKQHAPQAQPQQHPHLPYLLATFPDVFKSEQAKQYADGHHRMLRAQGKPDNLETVIESLVAARAALKTAPVSAPVAQRKPDPQARQRLAGQAAGPSGGGEDDDETPITMSAAQRRMARAKWPDLSEDKAFERWRKGPGARLQKKLQGA